MSRTRSSGSRPPASTRTWSRTFAPTPGSCEGNPKRRGGIRGSRFPVTRSRKSMPARMVHRTPSRLAERRRARPRGLAAPKRVPVLLPSTIPDATYLPVMGDASRRTGCIVAPVRGLGSADAAAPDERVAPSATGVVDGLSVEVGAAYRWASHLTPGLAVLDVGCGSGDGAVLLADAGARSVLGVGSDAEEVQAASQRHGDPARFT